MGLMQTISDPRNYACTQCLNSILTAELTDNAGWELLSELAHGGGAARAGRAIPGRARETEAEHLETIRSWLAALVTGGSAVSPTVEESRP